MNKKLIITLLLVSLASLIAEFFIKPHYYFEIEEYHFFYAIVSLVSCLLITFIAVFAGYILKRKENYYQDNNS